MEKKIRMREVLKLLLFLVYTTGIFSIPSIFLIDVVIINIGILIVVSRKEGTYVMKQSFQFLLSVSIFIAITVVLNIFFMDWKNAMMVGIRLILVCQITYLYSWISSTSQIAIALEGICKPLNWFGISTKGIGLMINIAISFLPILKEEVTGFVLALRAKGAKVTISNMLIVWEQLLNSLFKRTDEIEMALYVKGVSEEGEYK